VPAGPRSNRTRGESDSEACRFTTYAPTQLGLRCVLPKVNGTGDVEA